MGAAKKIDRLPEELLLEQYIKDGRAVRQRLSMRSLRNPDASLQCRVQHIDVGHSQRLSGIIVDDPSADLNPIIVFELPDGKRLIADGFHRHDAYSNLKRPDIPAWVIKGGMREAMEYATCCNQGMSLGRRREDVDKAVRMLLEEEEWLQGTIKAIALHVGCSKTLVQRIRDRHCMERGIETPQTYQRDDGRNCRRPRKIFDKPLIHQRKLPNGGIVYTGIGRDHKGFQCASEDAAQQKAEQYVRERKHRLGSLGGNTLETFFLRRQISFRRQGGSATTQMKTMAFVVGGTICTTTDFDGPHAITSAIGRITLLKRSLRMTNAREVILCYREYGQPTSIAVAEAVGFEFLTPDELAASLKGESAEGAD